MNVRGLVEHPSAEEFLAVIRTSTEGCAIIDVHMAGMNGIELMDALGGPGLQVKVVLMTAFDDPGVRNRAESVGVAVLRKPFDDSTLLAAIDHAAKPSIRQ